MKSVITMFFVAVTLFTTSSIAGLNGKSSILSREELKKIAVEQCRLDTTERHGEKAIEFIGSKSRWSKYLRAEVVKMRIRPTAKNAKKYFCVVNADHSVEYIVR